MSRGDSGRKDWEGKGALESGNDLERIDREIDDEISHHLELAEREHLARGLPPERARARALERFGDPGRLAEDLQRHDLGRLRRQRRAAVFAGLGRDLRAAARSLWRSPGFTAIVALTLALGLGGNAIIFTLIDAAMLRPLPFERPEELVDLRETREGLTGSVRFANYLDWRELASELEGVVAHQSASVNLVGDGDPQRLDAARVSADFFELLGVEASLGRTFAPAEDQAGRDGVVVLDHGFWRDRLGGDRSVVGTELELDGVRHTVIGVLPERFNLPLGPAKDVWLPRVFTAEERQDRSTHLLDVLARLPAGSSLPAARAETTRIASTLATEYPDTNKGWGIDIRPLRARLTGEHRTALLAISVGVGFLLLIACTNVSCLVLARASSRRSEIAVRTALGGGRLRSARPAALEVLMLGTAGGGLALALAALGPRVLSGVLPESLVNSDLRVDGRLVLFTASLSLAVGVVLATTVVLRAAVGARELRKVGRALVGGDARSRRLALLVESALLIALLIGAGLSLRSFRHLQSIDPGFVADGRLTFSLSAPPGQYADQAAVAGLFVRVADEIRSLPGVESVGVLSNLPLSGNGWASYQLIEGRPMLPPAERELSSFELAGAGTFDALDVPILRGRGFEARDDAEGTLVAVVSERLVQELFDGEDPLGSRISASGTPGSWATIVGVVGNTRHQEITEAPDPQLYLSHAQIDWPWRTLQFVVEGGDHQSPLSLLPLVRDAVARIDPALPVADAWPLDQVVGTALAQPRLQLLLIGSFALIATVLGGAGIYAVTALVVTQRRREIALRMALGARSARVLWLVLSQTLGPVGLGALLGTATALFLARWMEGLVHGVGVRDPSTYLALIVAFCAITAFAAVGPARKAMKIDPAPTLRSE